MRSSLLQRLRGWPRRVAAVLCLLAAAVSALAGPHRAAHADDGTQTRRPAGLAARLGAGQVAVPVAVTDPAGAELVHPGDRIGLLAGPATGDAGGSSGELLADHLRVLTARRSGGTLDASASAEIVVAAGRDDALRIASAAGRPVVPVLDDSG